MRVLNDRSRSELAAEGLEDPHPQPHARRAGSAVFYWCVLARFYGKQLQLAPRRPHGDGLAAAGGLLFLSALARRSTCPAHRMGAPSAPAGWRRLPSPAWERPPCRDPRAEWRRALLSPTLLFRWGCAVALLGALSAVRCTRTAG